MTKKELIKELEELEDLDDEAQILVYVPELENNYFFNIKWCMDKVTGKDVKNEITLVCK